MNPRRTMMAVALLAGLMALAARPADDARPRADRSVPCPADQPDCRTPRGR